MACWGTSWYILIISWIWCHTLWCWAVSLGRPPLGLSLCLISYYILKVVGHFHDSVCYFCMANTCSPGLCDVVLIGPFRTISWNKSWRWKIALNGLNGSLCGEWPSGVVHTSFGVPLGIFWCRFCYFRAANVDSAGVSSEGFTNNLLEILYGTVGWLFCTLW